MSSVRSSSLAPESRQSLTNLITRDAERLRISNIGSRSPVIKPSRRWSTILEKEPQVERWTTSTQVPWMPQPLGSLSTLGSKVPYSNLQCLRVGHKKAKEAQRVLIVGYPCEPYCTIEYPREPNYILDYLWEPKSALDWPKRSLERRKGFCSWRKERLTNQPGLL